MNIKNQFEYVNIILQSYGYIYFNIYTDAKTHRIPVHYCQQIYKLKQKSNYFLGWHIEPGKVH